LAFGGAGLLAHTIFLAVQWPAIGSQYGSLLFLAWILAVFYFYGSLHHRQVGWGVFFFPGVVGLGILTRGYPPGEGLSFSEMLVLRESVLRGLLVPLWAVLHVVLLLLAAVGVCVAFIASIMYLTQAKRLRDKVPLGHGQHLMSLERLETMNRRAIATAF